MTGVEMPETVAIIGASNKPDRYAYKAMQALREHGHDVELVNPYKSSIEGQMCYRSVADIDKKINTVTLYVNPTRFQDHIDEVISARPDRVIMNPGTEDAEMAKRMEQSGINVMQACTLVLLATGTY
jgi:predicted CoA-binding protein